MAIMLQVKARFRVGAILLALPLTPAIAQAPAGPDQDQTAEEAEANDDEGFGDIVVTAQRRAESLQDVPLSVAAVTGDALLNRHFGDPAQLQFVAPNLQFSAFLSTPGAVNFSVRGIGTQTFSHAIEPTVATVIDGVVMGRPEMAVMQFHDLERVEVLAGPQGTLFGKNASAGLINIVTKRPQLAEVSFGAHAEAAIINAARECCEVKVQTALNVPVSTNSALRLNAFYSGHNDLVTNLTPFEEDDAGLSQFGFRGKYLWEAGGLSVLVGGDYTESTGMSGGAFTLRQVGPGSVQEADADRLGIEPGPNNLHWSTTDAPLIQDFKVYGLQGEVQYEFSSGLTLTNIAAYRRFDSFRIFGGDLVQTLHAELENEFEQFTEELRVTSPSGNDVEYQAGLFYYDARANRRDLAEWNLRGLLDPLPPGFTHAAGFHAQNDVFTKSYAAYAQGSLQVTDSLKVTAGGRITHDDLTLVGSHDQRGFVIAFGVPAGDYNTELDTKKTDFSWRASAQYDFAPDAMVYVTAAEGYKGPGFNTSYSFGGSVVGSETTRSYEVGMKTRPTTNLLFNFAAYWQKVSGLQISGFVEDIQTFLITNAGGLRVRGVEADLKYEPVRNLVFSVSGAYNDAVFTEYRTAACYSGQTPAEGCVGGVVDATGNRLPNAPKWTGTMAADYEGSLSSTLDFFAHADVYGRTGVNFSANNNPSTAQSGYSIVNGSFGVGSSNKAWKASIFCRNCFDKRFVTFIGSSFPGGALFYNQTFPITAFRAIGLSLDANF